MSRYTRPQFISLGFGVFVLLFAIGFYASAQWSPPTSLPPGGNVPAPLNVGGDFQQKSGNLALNAANLFANGFLVPFGNVGIGTVSPGQQLTIRGNDNNIQIEQSSATDNLKFRFANNTGGFLGNVFYNQSDDSLDVSRTGDSQIRLRPNGDILLLFDPNLASANVGIGTGSPSTKLHVAGGARITGLVSCNTIDTDSSGNLVCGTDSGITSETDPQVGAVTSGQWCRGDGSAVQCNQTVMPTGLYGWCKVNKRDFLDDCKEPTGSPAFCAGGGGGNEFCACPGGYTLRFTGWDGGDEYYYTCYKN